MPNETEIFKITGVSVTNIEDAKKASQKLFNEGIKYVIIALGEKESMLLSKEKQKIILVYKVKAIDTIGAGDSFIGALANKINIRKLDFDNLKLEVELFLKL